jgi:predicted small metal-binding protein
MGLRCNYRIKGESIETVVQEALEHIREIHSAEFNNLASTTQLDEMKKSLMRSTRVVAG